MNSESLSVEIELAGDARPAGKVVLINRASTEVRLWRMGNSWGDETLSFEVNRNGQTDRVERKPQTYTRDVPSSVSVNASGRHEIPFDLRDGSWEPAAVIEGLAVGAELTAVYESRNSQEALEHKVWVGQVRGAPVRLE